MSTILEDATALAAMPTGVGSANHDQLHAKGNALLLKLAVAVATMGNPAPTEFFGVLEGQSNADGQARASELPAGYTGQLANTAIYTPVTGAFVPVQGGVTTSTAGADNWGVEVSMLKKLAANYGKTAYLSKFAVGGTQLAPGAGDDWSETSTGELYDQANANYTSARAALPGHAVARYEVWIQGESDANATYAAGYEARLTSRIAAKRAFYGSAVPIFIVQMSSGQTRLDATSLATVRQAQANVCANVAGCYLITTDDLPLDSEKLHWVAAGLVTLGERIADRIIAVLAGATSSETLAPLVTVDDLANTIQVTHRYGVAGTEARLTTEGAWMAYTALAGYNSSSGKIDVGDVDRAAGYYQFRTAANAGTGRTASTIVLSAAFTKTAGTPTPVDPDPTGANELPSTDLASAAWNPTDLTATGGQADADGGTTAVLLRPNNASNTNHNIHTVDFDLPAGTYDYYVRMQSAGFDFGELLIFNANTFSVVAAALVNAATGQKVSAANNATVAALTNGWYRAKLRFTWGGGRIFGFVKPWADATQAEYAGDGVKGINVSHAYLVAA